MVSDQKKISQKSQIAVNESDDLFLYVKNYKKNFIVHKTDSHNVAYSYICNLLRCEKNHTNIEKMAELAPELAYHQYHHFLSDSKWDSIAVNNETAIQTSGLMDACKSMSQLPTGYIIDESSHLKKGKASVGVSRQYAGVIGKVENCQVAVYSAMCNGSFTTLINTKLFLPQEWIDDRARCQKAGIPSEDILFKTKPQLALEMIKNDVKLGVRFDWIGGDGLYGHNSELTRGLDTEKLFYVLDIHRNETIYLSQPLIEVPIHVGHRGRKPINKRPNTTGSRVDTYCMELKKRDFRKVKIRTTAKGLKKVYAHKISVWHWDGKEDTAQKRVLLITKTTGANPQIKYSFSNGELEQYTLEEYAYFQCNRYWVERCFDDTKNELGLSGYQIRKSNAWYHHQALVMMASLFLLKEKIKNQKEYPLMSLRDARIMIIAALFMEEPMIEKIKNQMINRHKNRQRDIDRYSPK